MGNGEGLKERVARQSEETIGRFAQELLENPVVSGALSRAFETRERAMRAQEVAMGALNLPSASDLERLTRRVRSVSQRLEGIEDGLDRLDDRLRRPTDNGALEDRLANIERALERLEAAQARDTAASGPSAPPGTATTQASSRAGAAKRAAPKRAAPKSGGKRPTPPRPSSSS
jgi:CRP-like cAMP-binding protein